MREDPQSENAERDREPSRTAPISRRGALRGLGTTATATFVGLAGCAGGGDGTDGTDGNRGDDDSGGDGQAASPTPTGAATGTPTAPDTITIGLQADRTGVLASYGVWHERVVRGYVERLNAADGINGATIDLVVEDTGSDSKQGVTAFRKLVQQNGADFVVGSQSSGVSIATTPLARQTEIPYFPLGEAPSITGEDGNRWVVRNNHSTAHAAIIAVRYGLENLGENWTLVYQDYAFGQQYRDWVKRELDAGGGELLAEIPVPVGTSDLNSYLNTVPSDTEVLFNALVGPSALNFLKQSADLDTPGARLGPIASVEGVDVSGLGSGSDGAAYVTMLPRRLAEFDTEHNRHVREVARVNETDEVLNGGHYFVSYETLSWIKRAAEAVGWVSADDNRAFLEYFEEGRSVEQSDAFPQGPKFFRGSDHQAFMNMFVEEISDGKLTVEKRVEVDEPTFEPQADLAGQSF